MLPILVGDGIENPLNARTLINAAAMFSSRCVFRDRKHIGEQVTATLSLELETTTLDGLTTQCESLIALENAPGAKPIFGFKVPVPGRAALIVGNERHGIARDMASVATSTVCIPMFARQLNTLNVGAAAAVGMYYLVNGTGKPAGETAHPERRRPEILLMSPRDHAEIGSSLRSVGAFGWQRVLVDDSERVWFDLPRSQANEARAAPRRSRNPIRVIPITSAGHFGFDEVCVVTIRNAGESLGKATLSRGPGQLVVLPDESVVDVTKVDWGRLGRKVRFVGLDYAGEAEYQFRFPVTIALAETARQIGMRARGISPAPRRLTPFYDSALDLQASLIGELVFREDLDAY